MTDRDHFAAAALTGLLAGRKFTALDDAIVAEAYAEAAYGIADAMLRERANHIPDAGEMVETPTNLDAAPAARAPEPEPEPAARRRPAGGTGDTPEIASYARFVGEVMNWISEATGFLHDDVLQTDDARDIIADACSRCWDAFDRIAPTDHGAAPAARASVGRPRTDKADLPTCAGTGDTPKPINGPDLDSRVWETPLHTPPTHATPGEVSERREGAEPVAYGLLRVGGRWVSILDNAVQAETSRQSFDRMENWVHEIVPLYRSPPVTKPMPKEKRAEVCAGPLAWAAIRENGQPLWLSYDRSGAEGMVNGMAEVVPLYRSPTLTDAERKAVAFYSRFDTPQNGPVVGGHAAALRGLLERLGGER